MTALHRREVLVRDHDFEHFQGAWVMPKDQRRTGVILYLHGGGYTGGSLEYAKGFAAALASECGVRVFCAAYRLAPETPYPAAVDDALEAYRYLLKKGYAAKQILLCGESAGGGLIYACLSDMDAQSIIEFAVAASCLKHSIEGDYNMVTVAEVEKLAGGDGSGRIQR